MELTKTVFLTPCSLHHADCQLPAGCWILTPGSFFHALGLIKSTIRNPHSEMGECHATGSLSRKYSVCSDFPCR